MKKSVTFILNIFIIVFLVYSTSLAQKKLIQITEVSIEGPNSAGGIDVTISWKNLSKKTLKYIEFGVEAYNKVDDRVTDDVSGDFVQYCKSIGPYPSGSEDMDGWNNVWYNYSIVKAKVIEIELTWMDGTTKYLNKN